MCVCVCVCVRVDVRVLSPAEQSAPVGPPVWERLFGPQLEGGWSLKRCRWSGGIPLAKKEEMEDFSSVNELLGTCLLDRPIYVATRGRSFNMNLSETRFPKASG